MASPRHRFCNPRGRGGPDQGRADSPDRGGGDHAREGARDRVSDVTGGADDPTHDHGGLAAPSVGCVSTRHEQHASDEADGEHRGAGRRGGQLQAVGHEQRQQGELAAQTDLDEQYEAGGDRQHAHDARLGNSCVLAHLVLPAAVVDDRESPKNREDEHRGHQRQDRRDQHHLANREMIDQRPADARAHGLSDHPLRREQRQARCAEVCVKGGAYVRAGDRPDRDHHPRGEEVPGGDQRHRPDLRYGHDERAVEQLGRDQGSAVSEAVRDESPKPFENEHAQAEHRQRQPDLVRRRSQLPQLEREADLKHSCRESREHQGGDDAAAAAADE